METWIIIGSIVFLTLVVRSLLARAVLTVADAIWRSLVALFSAGIRFSRWLLIDWWLSRAKRWIGI